MASDEKKWTMSVWKAPTFSQGRISRDYEQESLASINYLTSEGRKAIPEELDNVVQPGRNFTVKVALIYRRAVYSLENEEMGFFIKLIAGKHRRGW